MSDDNLIADRMLSLGLARVSITFNFKKRSGPFQSKGRKYIY
jgi:hypothetical protein